MARPRLHDDTVKAHLLDAAGRILATEGPHALTTRRVAAEVGTSTSAIYSLLGSKAELVRAVFVEGFARLAAALDAVPAGDDPAEHLVALGFAYHDSALASPHLYRVMFERSVPEFEPTPEEILFSLATLQVLVDAVGRAADAGLVPPEPAEVALELWASTHGVCSLAISGMAGPPERSRAHLERVMRSLLTGYAACGAGADA